MATKWICKVTNKPYTPTRGEIARLNHWGASGACGCPDCSGIPEVAPAPVSTLSKVLVVSILLFIVFYACCINSAFN